jgi:hypothetical protein
VDIRLSFVRVATDLGVLCHKIESNPWEPADAFCISVGWTNPFTDPCGAYGAIREATKHH